MIKLPPIQSEGLKPRSPRHDETGERSRSLSAGGSSSPSLLPTLTKSDSARSEQTDHSYVSSDSFEPSLAAAAAESVATSFDHSASTAALRFFPTLSPLVISPATSLSRNPSMSPSSVPLRSLKCLETFPDHRPHSPGDAEQTSSLSLRKKALTPMNLLRSAASRTPPQVSPRGDGVSVFAPRASPQHTSPPVYPGRLPHGSLSAAAPLVVPAASYIALSHSEDSALTDAEVEETVKHAIAVTLREDLPPAEAAEFVDDWEMDPAAHFAASASASPSAQPRRRSRTFVAVDC